MRNPNLTSEEQRSLERRQRIKAYANRGAFRLFWNEPFAAIFLLGLLIWAPLALAELALWRGDRYPELLIETAPYQSLSELRQACGSPLEVKPIDHAFALTRCGMFWPLKSVWRVSRQVVDPAALK